MKTLEESGKPNLQYLVNELRNADPQLQKEFMKVMSKQYQNFTMVLFNRDHIGYTFKLLNANRYSQKNALIKSWQEENCRDSQKLSVCLL